jgi:Tfp pilus assembly protein PilV
MRIRPNNPLSAFSLVEILCAVLVLGVALVGMIEGVTTALSSTTDSEMQTVAALFAAGQIETLRAEGSLKDGTTPSGKVIYELKTLLFEVPESLQEVSTNRPSSLRPTAKRSNRR